MPLSPDRLRHRVTIQRPVKKQQSDGSMKLMRWESVFENVPAAIEPLSVRDFIASQAAQSEIVARIVIRDRDGLTPEMRVVHERRGQVVVYNPSGWLPDPESGLEYVTAPCSLGVNDGQ